MGKKERCGRASFPSRSILSPLRTQKAYVQPTAAGGKIRNTHLFVGRRKMLIVRVCEKLLRQKWEIHSFSFQVHVWFCDALSWCHEMSCRKQVLISVLVLWVCSVNDHESVQECILALTWGVEQNIDTAVIQLSSHCRQKHQYFDSIVPLLMDTN